MSASTSGQLEPAGGEDPTGLLRAEPEDDLAEGGAVDVHVEHRLASFQMAYEQRLANMR